MNKRIFSLMLAFLILAAVLLTGCSPDAPREDVAGEGVSLVNVSVDADRFIIPTPKEEAVYMDKYLPVAVWDLAGDGARENMRLTFCDMESGKMLDVQYILEGTDVPEGVMRKGDTYYLIAPTDTGYRGWTFSGAPESLTLTEVDGGIIEEALTQYETQHVTSADGTLSACHKQRDVLGHGGVYLSDETGAGRYIAENVMMTESSSSVGIQDIRVYSPVGFWGNDTLIYTIGGVEWAVGYGLYDIKAGETREVENGRGILAVTDDCLYTYLVMEYAITEVTKVEKDGTETVIASADTVTEEQIPFFSENIVDMAHTGDACIVWYYEDTTDTATLRLRVYDGDFTKVLLDADMSSTYAPMSDWVHYGEKILLFTPIG